MPPFRKAKCCSVPHEPLLKVSVWLVKNGLQNTATDTSEGGKQRATNRPTCGTEGAAMFLGTVTHTPRIDMRPWGTVKQS
jgi:hypothetical protein